MPGSLVAAAAESPERDDWVGREVWVGMRRMGGVREM